MRNSLTWILFLIIPLVLVKSRPTQLQHHDSDADAGDSHVYDYNAHNIPKQEEISDTHNEQVISVRITSSVAVGRGKGKISKIHDNKNKSQNSEPLLVTPATEPTSSTEKNHEDSQTMMTDIPPDLVGANIEFIKQLNLKKEALLKRGLSEFENIHSFSTNIENEYSNDTDDSIADSSIKSISEIARLNDEENDENIENVPLARSLSPSSQNYVQGLTHKSQSERVNNPRLTTVSFNIVHDTPKITNNYEPSESYISSSQTLTNTPKFYKDHSKFYNEPAKVYSQPAQVYSEPAKFYSEPAKIYSEPAKVYSEPAKIYSEPAKIYSEPAKFYSQPASLHLPPQAPPSHAPWQQESQGPGSISTTVFTTTPLSTMLPSTQRVVEQQPEKNYEVDEKVSVLTDGRSHGVQESTTESCKQENCKVGYVVEGRQYRKYRVEERTSDGFIVGEYGVVRNEDGALRGVRYTADSDASPRLIYDALMKFLQLK